MTIITTILSHIVGALYLQKQKYNKFVTACFWVAYAVFSTCIMLFQKNVIYGFFALFFMQALIFFTTTIGPLSEKIFLFLTYANSFCICIGVNVIMFSFGGNHAILPICSLGILILMHLFLYKILLPNYKKSRTFFSSGWLQLNIVLIFFLIQFLNQFAFRINSSNVGDMLLDFVIFSIIFYLSLMLIFNLVKDAAKANKIARENVELKNIAYIDTLTNMQNRAAYVEFTQRLASTHKENPDSNLIFVMADIDGFKHINDTKGHAAGDEILKQAGAVITKYLQPYDCKCFRFGGDEFILLIEDMQLANVKKLIEALNEELYHSSNITLSFGCSSVDFNNPKPFYSALKKADELMYSNKQQHHSIGATM